MKPLRVIVTPIERRELERRVRSRVIRAEDSRRALVILTLASGTGVRATAAQLGCSTSFVQRWRSRFIEERLSGLAALHQGRARRTDAAKLEARVLELTRLGPDDGTTHWSCRRLAARLKTNHMTVARIWNKHGLQPHRLRHHMVSNDANFEQKAADIIGLYI
jgi:transposase